MTEIIFRRQDYDADPSNCQHAGLKLERGFGQWNTENNQYNAQKKAFYNQLIEIKPSQELYESAYNRWEDYLKQHQDSCKSWLGKIDGRLYLGLGEANPLESAVTLHHTYGVPFIPGSAVKGVLHHALLTRYATSYDPDKKKYHLEDAQLEVIHTLFGREPDKTNPQDIGEAGYVIFNDAWWVPGNKLPLVKEIVTVHHQEYYAGEKEATDFDSPIPNQQIAIQGEFLFSVQGEPSWADFAIKLLQQTLHETGVGAKTSSGYGYFKADSPMSEVFEEIWDQAELSRHTRKGPGMIIEAKFEGKTASRKWEELIEFVQALPESSQKKLKKNALQHAIKVKKEGNNYQIVELIIKEI